MDNIGMHYQFRLKCRQEANKAFDKAIEQGRLSENKDADNYVDKYMYMGLSQYNGVPMFKNIKTRQYDV